MDAKQYVDAYQFQNGMLNVAWVAGFMCRTAEKAPAGEERAIHVRQTQNLNHTLPIHLRNHTDRVPPRFKDGEKVKCTCRITGRKLENGERIAVLECMDFDVPTIMDMPPDAAWDLKPPPGAPTDDFEPKSGDKGPRFSRRSNVAKIAGFICGIVYHPADPAKGDQYSTLQILIAQKGDLDLAVPVRMRNKHVEAMHKVLRIGMPILINDGEFRVRVKETGEPAGEGGIKPVMRYPYIEAFMPKQAGQDDILGDPPAWAFTLAQQGRVRKTPPKVEGSTPVQARAHEPVADVQSQTNGKSIDADLADAVNSLVS